MRSVQRDRVMACRRCIKLAEVNAGTSQDEPFRRSCQAGAVIHVHSG